MAKVQDSSSINISRRKTDSRTNSEEPLGNKLFNGYVYNFSLSVGINGEPSSLTLNLALNKSLQQALAGNSPRRLSEIESWK